MPPRHAWELVPHEHFERAVADAPLVLRVGAPAVSEVGERHVSCLAPDSVERGGAHRLSADVAHPFDALRLALVAQLEERVAIRLGDERLALALPRLSAFAHLAVEVPRLALDGNGGEAHASRPNLAHVLHAHAQALARAASAESGQNVGCLVRHPRNLGEHLPGLSEAVDLLRARRALRGHLVFPPERVGWNLFEIHRKVKRAAHDYQRVVRVAVGHAVEPFLHVERPHLVDGDARPPRLAMVLPGAQVEALGIARAALVLAFEPGEVSRLVKLADRGHYALVALRRLNLRQLVAGLAVRAVHGAASAPAALGSVLDPSQHVFLAARGLRDGAPCAAAGFSWHNRSRPNCGRGDMSKDDMHVVMYKILKYLYECLKQGKEARDDKYCAGRVGINEKYWTAIMLELIERDYVRGFKVARYDDSVSIIPAEPTITMLGVDFLLDNSMMKKAHDFIVDMKDFIPLP